MNTHAWPLGWLGKAVAAALVVAVAVLVSAGERPVLAAPPNDDIADWAIGTPTGFDGGVCNNGLAAPTAWTLCGPTETAWDPAGNLFIVDTDNNRVLEYTQPLTTDLVADRVYGQPNFTTRSCAVASSTSLCEPRGVAVGGGNLFVADSFRNRVLVFQLGSDAVADGVYGQSTFAATQCDFGGPSASTLCYPTNIAVDSSQNVFINDAESVRVLGYFGTSDRTADRVFGQPNMTSAGSGTGILQIPSDIDVDANGNLLVSEYIGARIAIFLAAMTTDQVLDGYGGGTGCTPVSASTMCKMSGVAVGPNDLVYAVEYDVERVLIYQSPLQSGWAADFVLGTNDSFTMPPGFCNGGSLQPSRGKLCAPVGISVHSSGTVALPDSLAHRVLLYQSPDFTDRLADRVVGQPSVWTSSACNAGGVSASSLCFPRGVAVDSGGNVYVSDFMNHRVLQYNTPLTTDFVADRVFGQGGSYTANTYNSVGLGANSLGFPADIAVDAAGNLYIADNGNGRVLQYNTPLTTDTTADRVFGQPNFTSNSCLAPNASRLCSPVGIDVDSAGNVYISDYQDSRVLQYNTPLTTDVVADRVFGKANFTTSGCNTIGLNASSLCQPWGVAIDAAGALYVGDALNSRVLKYDSPLTTDAVADAVMGQPDFFSQDCNNFLPVDADALCRPNGVEVNGTDLYISDSFNSRILRSNGTGPPLQVFGQLGSFTTNNEDAGGAQSARGLDSQVQITTDSVGRLYVADTDNSRVLIFNVSDDPDLDLIAFAVDNCPTVNNPTQAWSDRNLVDNSPPYAPATDDKTLANSDPSGDACDVDSDNDGLLNSSEASGASCASIATNPQLRDSDGDLVLDGAECVLGFNPMSAASKPLPMQCGLTNDVDGDKIVARTEFCYYNTNPSSADSDGDKALDGAKDGCEIASVNGDRVVSSGDQGMLAGGITGTFAYHPNIDINKDGNLNSGDQGLMASFISPPGQCPG